MKKQAQCGVGTGIIVVPLRFLAWLGYGESKTYCRTIAGLETLSGSARTQRMRVAGTVEEGSIRHLSGRIDFVLMGKERPFRLLTLAAILCRTRLWARRKPLWKAVPARTADLSRSTYRRNAPPSMKRPLGETRRAPQPVLPREVVCKRPGTSGGEAGSLWMYLVPLRSL